MGELASIVEANGGGGGTLTFGKGEQRLLPERPGGGGYLNKDRRPYVHSTPTGIFVQTSDKTQYRTPGFRELILSAAR